MTVFLVPAGRDRFELYSEGAEDLAPLPSEGDGRFRRWMHRVGVRWNALVESARRGGATGRLARWRDQAVCRLAETIAEQRTLWSLRSLGAASLRYPSTMQEPQVRARLTALLEGARGHHLKWFVLDLLLFVASGVLFFVPGPNLIAYYFAFRFVTHLQSWRGARQGLDIVAWAFEPDAGLAELGSLVDVPREARASRVNAIAERLNLRRLSAFFDRVAVRST